VFTSSFKIVVGIYNIIMNTNSGRLKQIKIKITKGEKMVKIRYFKKERRKIEKLKGMKANINQ